MKKPTKMPVERVNADISCGLTSSQVEERVKAKQTNYVKKVVGKSYLAIFTSNFLTFFNFLGLLLFVIMLACGSYENMLFAVIILANTAIGIVQEIRSKRTVEKLSIVHEPTLVAIRDGVEVTLNAQDVVLDDVVIYNAGKQIVADGVVASGMVEVNESLLTGESVPVKKHVGDTLYAGSFVVAGNCYARVSCVGEDNYVEQLSSQVKQFKKPNSQLMKGITTIIKIISWIIFPIGFGTYLTSGGLVDGHFVTDKAAVIEAIKSASGSMIGMVPSGMVLLSSVALAVSVIRLALKKVLVRELFCIETLARVDTLCLDKTGTITDGTMTVEKVIKLDNNYNVETLVADMLAATGDVNTTANALRNYFNTPSGKQATAVVPFSSARKFSGATIDGTTVCVGATEFLIDNPSQDLLSTQEELLRQGYRVVVVAVSNDAIVNDVATNLQPVAIVALQDTVRSDAKEIISWFAANDVDVKIISGDNPLSVSVIAQKVGVKDADKYVSLDGMTDEQVAEIATRYTVFGRVSPEQKAVLVKALKANGQTVAMMGDGVNDILAMRESDCAVSVGCGSDPAKTVAQIVLTDNQFASMPKIVAEGRRVVNNVQSSSSLFLMKTCMTVFTSVLLMISNKPYPFQPQNLYAIEFFIIGICSFLLALKPNHNIIRGSFVKNVLSSTVPSGLAMFLSVAMTYAFAKTVGVDTNQAQLATTAMFSMTFTGLIALLILLFPYDKANLAIAGVATVGTSACFLVFPWALGLIAEWTGSQQADPIFVAIPTKAIWFIVINVLAMGVIIVAGKLILKQTQKNK